VVLCGPNRAFAHGTEKASLWDLEPSALGPLARHGAKHRWGSHTVPRSMTYRGLSVGLRCKYVPRAPLAFQGRSHSRPDLQLEEVEQIPRGRRQTSV